MSATYTNRDLRMKDRSRDNDTHPEPSEDLASDPGQGGINQRQVTPSVVIAIIGLTPSCTCPHVTFPSSSLNGDTPCQVLNNPPCYGLIISVELAVPRGPSGCHRGPSYSLRKAGYEETYRTQKRRLGRTKMERNSVWPTDPFLPAFMVSPCVFCALFSDMEVE